MRVSSALSVAGLLLALAAVAVAVGTSASMRLWRTRYASLEESFGALRREIELVASISVRTGRRLQRIEQEYSGVADRVEMVESRGVAGSFDQAIDLARRGADSSKLAEQFGLSPGEADLVVRLHARKKRA